MSQNLPQTTLLYKNAVLQSVVYTTFVNTLLGVFIFLTICRDPCALETDNVKIDI